MQLPTRGRVLAATAAAIAPATPAIAAPPVELMHHSDAGSQYTSYAFTLRGVLRH